MLLFFVSDSFSVDLNTYETITRVVRCRNSLSLSLLFFFSLCVMSLSPSYLFLCVYSHTQKSLLISFVCMFRWFIFPRFLVEKKNYMFNIHNKQHIYLVSAFFSLSFFCPPPRSSLCLSSDFLTRFLSLSLTGVFFLKFGILL